MKIIQRIPDSSLTAFEYRGTEKSRERLLEMAFCESVGPEEEGRLRVGDRASRIAFVRAHHWIIVESGFIVDVLDPEAFKSQYEVVGEQ